MAIVIIGTLISIIFIWCGIRFEYFLDKSRFARFVRKNIWQKSIDTKNMKTYRAIIDDYKASIHADVIDLPYISKFFSYLNPGSKILDFGCGSGNLTASFCVEGFDATGSDISDDFISIAETNHPEVSFLKASSEELTQKNLSFDAIFAAYSLIHFEKIMVPHVLSDFNKLLTKEGYLYLSLQNDDSEGPESYRGACGEYPVPYRSELNLYLNLFTRVEIKNDLETEGFKVVDIQYRDPVENEFPFRKMFIIAQKE